MRRALRLDRTGLIAETGLASASATPTKEASAIPGRRTPSPPLLGLLLFCMLLPDGLFDRLSLLFVVSAAQAGAPLCRRSPVSLYCQEVPQHVFYCCWYKPTTSIPSDPAVWPIQADERQVSWAERHHNPY